MIATATRPTTTTTADETVRQHIANALQILAQDDVAIGDLDIAAVRERLRAALAEADTLEAKYAVSVELLRDAERERLELVNEAKDRQEFFAELEPQGLHVHIPFDEPDGPYKLQRRYVRTIAACESWAEVVALKTELAKLSETLTKNKPKE